MQFIPLFHRCDTQRCLFVGGGKVALRKAKYFVDKGMVVDVISPAISQEFENLIIQSQGTWFKAYFSEELTLNITQKYWCIIAATDSTSINRQVAAFAKAQYSLINVVDDTALCDFIFPAIIERESLTIAISNAGSSPVLSRLLKKKITMLIPDSYGKLSQFIGENRNKVKAIIENKKTLVSFWEHVIQGSIAKLILAGNPQEAAQQFDKALANPEAFNCCGSVSLIGIGSGSTDLLTIRALRLIQQANIVIYDDEVSKEVMQLISDDVTLIKACSIDVSVDFGTDTAPNISTALSLDRNIDKNVVQQPSLQSTLNQLLLEHAKQGKHSVRLKSGDSFTFDHTDEDLSCFTHENISFEIL